MSFAAPEIGSFNAPDGYPLSVRRWRVERPVGEVVYLHGIISHSGWYESSCAHLARDGFNVHFIDRRGSGLNWRDRGDVRDWSVWIADVVSYLKHLPSQRPKILLGISWGGILATAVVKQEPSLVSGLGLICPGLCSHKATTGLQKTLLGLAGPLGLGGCKVNIPLRDPSWFTNSSIHRKYIAEDPLTLRKITIRFARNNIKLLAFATEVPEQVKCPVLLMLAGSDSITDNLATRALFDRFASRKKQIYEYQGAAHTLEFEADPAVYLRDLAGWCHGLSKQTTSD